MCSTVPLLFPDRLIDHALVVNAKFVVFYFIPSVLEIPKTWSIRNERKASFRLLLFAPTAHWPRSRDWIHIKPHPPPTEREKYTEPQNGSKSRLDVVKETEVSCFGVWKRTFVHFRFEKRNKPLFLLPPLEKIVYSWENTTIKRDHRDWLARIFLLRLQSPPPFLALVCFFYYNSISFLYIYREWKGDVLESICRVVTNSATEQMAALQKHE